MKLEKIIYQKAFVIGPYLQEKVGVEISIDEQDNPDNVFKDAKTFVEKWHIENNPHLSESLPEIQVKEDTEIETQFNDMKVQIVACKCREQAEVLLKGSSFKFNMELKALVESLPPLSEIRDKAEADLKSKFTKK